jgi:hypothetical protein
MFKSLSFTLVLQGGHCIVLSFLSDSDYADPISIWLFRVHSREKHVKIRLTILVPIALFCSFDHDGAAYRPPVQTHTIKHYVNRTRISCYTVGEVDAETKTMGGRHDRSHEGLLYQK